MEFWSWIYRSDIPWRFQCLHEKCNCVKFIVSMIRVWKWNAVILGFKMHLSAIVRQATCKLILKLTWWKVKLCCVVLIEQEIWKVSQEGVAISYWRKWYSFTPWKAVFKTGSNDIVRPTRKTFGPDWILFLGIYGITLNRLLIHCLINKHVTVPVIN